jgi:hypothetical protein
LQNGFFIASGWKPFFYVFGRVSIEAGGEGKALSKDP